jgi:hypothetical protein
MYFPTIYLFRRIHNDVSGHSLKLITFKSISDYFQNSLRSYKSAIFNFNGTDDFSIYKSRKYFPELFSNIQRLVKEDGN